MKRYYEDRAPWHDVYMGYKSVKEMEATLQPIVDTIVPQTKDQSVLEIACGTGNWTQILAKHAKSVAAVDSSPSSLTIARSKLSGLNNCSLRLADVYTLEGVGESYELIFAADLLSHVPVKLIPQFMGTLFTKASHRARATFIDMSMASYFRDEESYVHENGDRVGIRTLPNGHTYQVVKNFFSEKEIIGRLSPFGSDLTYMAFPSLQRWLITFRLNPPREA
jgi:2-polyprenyl-3-methyl-5-hydroxy-6-metoxy-1,4-benzoquinol methylase